MKKEFAIFSLILSLAVSSTAWAITYVVGKGDALSKIAKQYYPSERVYGKNGSLNKVLAANPSIKNPDLIFPGQALEVGEKPLVAQVQEQERKPAQDNPKLSSSTSSTPALAPVPIEPAGQQADEKKLPTSEELKQELAGLNTPAEPIQESVTKPTPKNAEITAPKQEEDTELNLRLSTGYGASLVGYQQSGAFGGIKGFPIAINVFGVSAEADYDKWRGHFSFSRYSLNLGTDTANPSAKESKTFQDLSFAGGYGIFTLGLHGKTTPVMKTSGATGVLWGDLTTMWAQAGVHLEKTATGRSQRPYRLTFDATAEYPVSSAGSAGLNISDLSGYGLKLKGRAQKALFKGPNPQIFLGIEGIAAYGHLEYNGSWSGLNGAITQNLQEYQALISLTVEL